MNDQLPPSTFRSANSQFWKVLPVSLQRRNVASKKLHDSNRQLTNAESLCSLTLKRTLRKTQSVNVAPELRSSVMSTSSKTTPSYSTPSRSRPYQSSPAMLSLPSATRRA